MVNKISGLGVKSVTPAQRAFYLSLGVFAVKLCTAQVLGYNGITLSDISSHPAWQQLDKLDCGESAADRIIGGLNAAIGQFPWMARLGYVTKDIRWATSADINERVIDFRCGGALVTKKSVITAAHCLITDDEVYSLYVIRLGEYNIDQNPDCQFGVCAPPVQDHLVQRLIEHNQFNTPPFHNDIALVEMKTPALLNEYVTPICLPRSMIFLNEKDLVTAAGWGRTNMTTEETAVTLQYIQIPVVNPETCDSMGKKFKMSMAEICAGGETDKDACLGDSGGPLMKVFDSPDGPKSYLMGVVSFGPAYCGRKPGVYASITYFLPWLLDKLIHN